MSEISSYFSDDFAETSAQANVYVGWAQAFVLCADNSKGRRPLEDVFMIAMISWYSLTIMNKIASFYLLEAFRDLSAGKSQILQKKSRTMRLTFMDAASSSRPIRWTTFEQDLWLLERIHKIWSSERLWVQLEEQTRTLAAHHDQLEEEENRTNANVLGFVAMVIAGSAFTSALVDERQLLQSANDVLKKNWIDTSGWLIGWLIPLFCLIGLLIFWHRREIRQAAEQLGEDLE